MIARIDEARSNGDSVGGVFEVVARGVPIGLGSYVHWDRRLDAALAAAVMSINIIKGVEFGLGFEQTRRFGSQVHDVIERRDEMGRWIHRSNNAGGLTGGVSNGQPIVVRAAVKPISTIARPLPTADLVTGEPVEKAHYERSDISVVPAAGVIGEAMVAITLADAMLDKFGGDSLAETRDNLERYRERIGRALRRRRCRAGATGGGAAGRSTAPRSARPTKSAPAATTRPDGDGPRARRPARAAARASSASALAQRHGATFVDLDEMIEREARPHDPRDLRGRRRGRRSGPASSPRSASSGAPDPDRRCGASSPRAAARRSTRATAGSCTAAASPCGSTRGPRCSRSDSAAPATSGRSSPDATRSPHCAACPPAASASTARRRG